MTQKTAPAWPKPVGLLAHYIEDGLLPEAATRMMPAEVAEMALTEPGMAARLEELSPMRDVADRPGESLLAAALEAPVETRRRRIREAFGKMPPESAHWMPVLFPGVIGNLAGAPWRHRITANLIRMAAELPRERELLCRTRKQDRINRSNRIPWDDGHAVAAIAQSTARIAYYEMLLDERRQVLLFEPRGDGEIAELRGTLGAATRNCGVIVPGTGSDMGCFDRVSIAADSLVDATSDGSLAIVAWLGGDMPDDIPAASRAHYAVAMAPQLVEFVQDMREEIADSVPEPAGVKVTVVGHSYGGSVVGSAELLGLNADRILHVASAGMGNGVRDPGSYRNPCAAVQRFSMTAPGDPIRHIQGRAVMQIGHGPHPDTFPGVVRLETGCYPDDESLGEKAGKILCGPSAHSDVFVRNCEAWRNIHEVFVGGNVTLWRSSAREQIRTVDVL